MRAPHLVDAADFGRSLIYGGELLIERWRSSWAPMVRVWAAYLQASFTSQVIVIAIRSYHNTGFATFSTEASRRNAGSDRGANDGRGS
jgi:hypothetical protein